MSDLSDFLEDRLLEVALGQSAYQVPTVLRVTTLDDTATYTVTINGVDYDGVAVGGDTEAEVLDKLETALGGAPDITVTRFQDPDATEALRIAQDASYAPLSISTSVTGTGALTGSQEVYAALFTTAVGEDGSGTEVSNSGYDRQVLPLSSVSSGASANGSDVVFGPAGVGGYGTVTHAAVYDSLTGGNLLLHSALAASRTVAENDTFTFRAGDLSAALD